MRSISPKKHPTETHLPLRVALLRPLEAGDYIPHGGSEVMKVDDVLFIMATSKKRDELKGFQPPDFWTRMTHFVDIAHPLEIYTPQNRPDETTIERVLAKFFNFFWWERVEDLYEAQRGEDGHLQTYSEKLLDWQRKTLHSVVREGFTEATIGKDEVQNLVGVSPPQPGVLFAQTLRQVLKDQKPKELQPHQCSVRGIRNMVYRLFYISATRVAQGEHVLPPIGEFKDTIRSICEEIVPIANLTPAKQLSVT
jgi:hypothetical protein